ncbi:MAG: A/G-specific adenine glycosylase [Nitrospirae bacterium]|nr:A/G-specific adenine glycosylase [Nitrospirota bacterium]MBI3352825.1 A/G-specific adenine glycosylase [Nitrospirota bacterium]
MVAQGRHGGLPQKILALKVNPEISKNLLRWYKQNGRELPWRTSFSPYSVWVSEIMLQQTQVDTVIPYYHRFLSSFPSVQALAEAPLDKVLKGWEGLGYYSRARNLQKSAKIIVKRLQSRFPDQFEEIIKLPGIGKSTAGAILSLAFNQRFPILDGNVRRVLSRLFAVQTAPGPKTDQNLWDYSSSLVPKQAREFNSALMDLGATVCKPKQPSCGLCPLNSFCLGFKKNLQMVLPLKKKREKIPLYFHAGMVIWKNKKVLIRKRPVNGLLGGLWEFPESVVDQADLTDQTKLNRVCQNLNIKLKNKSFLFKLTHTFTHFKMELHVFEADYLSGNIGRDGSLRWASLEETEGFPFSTTHKKIIQNLADTRFKNEKTSKTEELR